MHCEKVKIGKKTFRAGCGRKKKKNGARRHKPHWGAAAKAKARKNAMKNPEFRAYKNALPKANKACARHTKAFSKARGACIKKHFKAMDL